MYLREVPRGGKIMGVIVNFITKEEMQMCKRITPQYVNDIRQNRYTIDNAVEKIFEECGITSYPINVFDIARKLNFDIRYVNFVGNKISGAMWDGKEELTIGEMTSKRFILVNKSDTPEQRAFTVAHELGHFMLHCDDGTNFYEKYHAEQDEDKKKEDEADFFGINLLMPSWIIQAYIDRNKDLPHQVLIKHICEDFLVEEAAVEKRFREIGYTL